MIDSDVSAYVNGAYAVALSFLAVLTIAVVLRGLHWAKRARELERKP
ncbi:hypothetical protein U91I_03215 [alpha proteobacterium U9-1i]|nr:hypothetical protein U91I_03215 [alpha proteobacterium U9-1i]